MKYIQIGSKMSCLIPFIQNRRAQGTLSWLTYTFLWLFLVKISALYDHPSQSYQILYELIKLDKKVLLRHPSSVIVIPCAMPQSAELWLSALKNAYNSADLFSKNYNVDEMKTDIKVNLLDESIIENTFEKVVKFAIRKQFFSGGGIFAIPLVLKGQQHLPLCPKTGTATVHYTGTHMQPQPQNQTESSRNI